MLSVTNILTAVLSLKSELSSLLFQLIIYMQDNQSAVSFKEKMLRIVLKHYLNKGFWLNILMHAL